MEIVFAVINVVVIGFLVFQLREQDKAIKDLTNRLVARNHSEYLSTRIQPGRPPDDKPQKRMSWYDDPMEGDEE
ncbi:hypothetical protein [Paenibacillus sp. FSL H3-0457]|uniref:hypothetical protein n=1 Tax=Paenibacillus sp. FSL H3-0457 TaxID=2921430 RepID=UPI0030EE36D9